MIHHIYYTKPAPTVAGERREKEKAQPTATFLEDMD
jgi:hypothetical protein